jgi:leucyl aminopeptidase
MTIMELGVETRSPSEARADALVLGQYGEGARPAAEITRLDRTLGGLLSRVLKSEKFEGKAGQISYFHTGGAVPAERILVVGLGPLRRGARARDAEPIRRGTAAAVRRARDRGAATNPVFMPPGARSARERAHAVAEGPRLGGWAGSWRRPPAWPAT